MSWAECQQWCEVRGSKQLSNRMWLRFNRSDLRAFLTLGNSFTSEGHPALSSLCWHLVGEQDQCFSHLPGGTSECGALSVLKQLQQHWHKWVGKEQLWGEEDYPRVSQIQSWVRLSDMAVCLSFADGWRKWWSSDCQEQSRGILGMCQLAWESD